MTFATLMVQLEPGRSNAGLLRVAAGFAEKFHAKVVGIAACQPVQFVYGENYSAANIIEQDRDQIDRDIKVAEVEFVNAFKSRATSIEWHSAVTFAPLADYIAREARHADLILTSVGHPASMFDGNRRVATGDLVMQAGRPVLVAPATVERLSLDHVLVGWKNTREARRALADAVPLLRLAGKVTILAIAPDARLAAAGAELQDIGTWLKRHDVTAHQIVLPAMGEDASRLDGFAQDEAADLIVAGAYGHSRLREWALGGVTRDLLLCADRCIFVSH